MPRAGDSPSLTQLGWNGRWEALAAEPLGARADAFPARVVRHDGTAVLVSGGERTEQARIRPGSEALAVGDWVLVADATVVALLPRATLLQRRDPTTGNDQPIAANVETLGIVCGVDRPWRPGRVERFVTLAWDAGAVPVVVLTKGDLGVPAEVEASLPRVAPGVDAVVTSVRPGAGLDELRALASGRTIAFLGESGAGKSSLVNALAGRELATTGAVRAGDQKGRHTTTARQLHVLEDCCVIDTPGLREVGLWTDTDTVDAAFGEIAALAGECRFVDCAHDTEPGCAVLAAVDAGRLDATRLTSWRAQRREAAAAEARADVRTRRQAERRFGRVAREAQRLKRR